MKSPFSIIILTLLLAVFSTPSFATVTGGIDWHKQGMPTALKLAKQQNRPLFVYWGAVWCPPCNVVKTTIFKDPDFIHATRDYINVYLDGDTEAAQQWGDRLKARGYPTLMILSPQGKEVLRLSTAQSGRELAQTLDFTRHAWQPMRDLLDQLQTADEIDAPVLQAVASYSWEQDDDVTEQPGLFADKLFELENRLPADTYGQLRSSLFLQALSLKIDALPESEKLPQADRQRYLNRLNEILDHPDWRNRNLLALAYSAEKMVSHLTSADDQAGRARKNLIDHFQQVMQTIRERPQLTPEQFYASFNPAIDFHESFDRPLTDADKKALIRYTLKAIKQTHDKKARAAMLSDASYTLFKFGLKDDARKIIRAALKDAIAPYYLMSLMGYFEKTDGHDELALEWYQKAWQNAAGPATRLQWYGTYVRNLIKLKPQDSAAIKHHVSQLLRKYSHLPDSFYGRNERVLASVRRVATKWAESNLEEDWLQSLRQQGEQACKVDPTKALRKDCEKFYAAFAVQE